jgi:hypothetical protein
MFVPKLNYLLKTNAYARCAVKINLTVKMADSMRRLAPANSEQ